jgi:hypothetical protein
MDIDQLKDDKAKYEKQMREAANLAVSTNPQVNALSGVIQYLDLKIKELDTEKDKP